MGNVPNPEFSGLAEGEEQVPQYSMTASAVSLV
jgi:hypothetical protein